MKFSFSLLLLVFPLLGMAQTNQPYHSIIPEPNQVIFQKGTFVINSNTKILVEDRTLSNSGLVAEVERILYTATWLKPEVIYSATEMDTVISIGVSKTKENPDPGAYELTVSKNRIDVMGVDEAGIFYGIQTLRQLLPPEIEHADPSLVPNNQEWEIPAVKISDAPRFQYRGMHLDVGRHFFPVEFIKKYIDLLAMHKMNRFHWHLTEDQGWRIEIKKYPRLTEIGAWRDSTLIRRYGSNTYDNIRYGGYYTQEEIKDIVAYAQSKYITIIPEIELPGHSSAALAAYPEFGCFEKEYKVQSTWGIFEDIYCPKEETFDFLEDVLDEVIALFPSKYIHIGGDEAPKKQWEESEIAQKVIKREKLKDEHELQSYFITRIEKYLNSKGRQIIGWDEILEGGLAPQATVMSWRGEKGGIEAAKMGHDVIMTPWNSNYFDHYQATPSSEPLAIGGFTTLKDVYHYEPIPEELSEKEGQHVLGAQGNVWTEYMHTPNKVEYMAFPRAVALSEVLWSAVDQNDWLNFWARLQLHFQRLDILEVNYAPHYRGQFPDFGN